MDINNINIEDIIEKSIEHFNTFYDGDEVYKILVSIDNNDENSKLYINNLKNEISDQLFKQLNIESRIREIVHLYLIG